MRASLIAVVVAATLTACANTAYVNTKDASRDYIADSRACQLEAYGPPFGKSWADKLNDCVADKGWVRRNDASVALRSDGAKP